MPTIEQDIARGIEIREQIAVLAAELKAIEKRIEAVAIKGPHVPLEEAEREGKQRKLSFAGGRLLPVRFESDQLVGSFAKDSPMHVALAAIVGAKFSVFFKAQSGFKRKEDDGNKFRKLARHHLEPETFARFIQAATARDKEGIAKSKTVIAWDHTQPAV